MAGYTQGQPPANSGQTTVLKVDGGQAATQFPEYVLRLDFGTNGASINPSGSTTT